MNHSESIAWQTVAEALRTGRAEDTLRVAEQAAFLDYRAKLDMGAGDTLDTYTWCVVLLALGIEAGREHYEQWALHLAKAGITVTEVGLGEVVQA
jgi:hypothetical protein